MEEFSLEKYQTGDYDVFTRDGCKVRIVCTDRKSFGDIQILALLKDSETNESILTYDLDGIYRGISALRGRVDLRLVKKQWKPEKCEKFWYIEGSIPLVYSTRYRDSNFQNEIIEIGNCFKTEEEAQEKVDEILEILKK